jgi:carboxymethylenebutenolidase
MNAYVARPQNATGAGIIVFQEAFGVNEYIRDICERFARLGFTAVAPELFHRTGPGFEGAYDDYESVRKHMSGLTNEGIAEDAREAYERLSREPGVDKERIAAIGFCMGGRAAYIANAELPLHAAVSFYGGGIAPDLLGMAPQQHAPILMFWGGKDQHIPPIQYRSVADALTDAGKTHEQVVFSQADHGFFCDRRASYEAGASRQAWALAQEFLRTFDVLR